MMFYAVSNPAQLPLKEHNTYLRLDHVQLSTDCYEISLY